MSATTDANPEAYENLRNEAFILATVTPEETPFDEEQSYAIGCSGGACVLPPDQSPTAGSARRCNFIGTDTLWRSVPRSTSPRGPH